MGWSSGRGRDGQGMAGLGWSRGRGADRQGRAGHKVRTIQRTMWYTVHCGGEMHARLRQWAEGNADRTTGQKKGSILQKARHFVENCRHNRTPVFLLLGRSGRKSSGAASQRKRAASQNGTQSICKNIPWSKKTNFQIISKQLDQSF